MAPPLNSRVLPGIQCVLVLYGIFLIFAIPISWQKEKESSACLEKSYACSLLTSAAIIHIGFIWISLVHLYRFKGIMQEQVNKCEYPSFWVALSFLVGSLVCGFLWFLSFSSLLTWENYTPLSYWMRSWIWSSGILLGFGFLIFGFVFLAAVSLLGWECIQMFYQMCKYGVADHCNCCLVSLQECLLGMARIIFPCVQTRQGEEFVLVAEEANAAHEANGVNVANGIDPLIENPPFVAFQDEFHDEVQNMPENQYHEENIIQESVHAEGQTLLNSVHSVDTKQKANHMQMAFQVLDELRTKNHLEKLQLRDKVDSCMICMENFYPESAINVRLPCWHYYHQQCHEKFAFTQKKQVNGCIVCKK